MIRAFFVFVGVYVIYGFVYALGLGRVIHEAGWAAKVSDLSPMSLWGFGVVCLVTWLVCRKL